MISRRHFLQQVGTWTTMLSMGHAAAQTASDYKALVCVFLAGGNDAYNTVLPTDSTSWSAYNAVRNQQPSPISLLQPYAAADLSKAVGSPEWLGGVLPLSGRIPSGRSVGLHPRLKRLQGLFNTERRLAVVSNVGPLIEPLSKDQYSRATGRVPKKLFSHNDQQNTWQALAPEGATLGWGGLLVDAFVPSDQNPGLFGAISVSGNAVWLAGQKVKPYQMGSGGAVVMGGGGTLFGSSAVASALKRIASNGMTGPSAVGAARAGHVLMADLGTIAQRSIDAEAHISAALQAVPATDVRVGPDTRLKYSNLYGVQTDNNLAKQLQAVARTIGARSTLGAGRQVFFVQLGGFDTHDNQNFNHADLMARLDHALAYFDETLAALGVRNMVTTFTASDFGRTFTSNGDGTDHGWGGHHFVLGGAVNGGAVYGSLPTLAPKNTSNNNFDGSADQIGNGALLPTTSVDQYAATLGKWFGLSDSQLNNVFPNLRNFSTRYLSFVG